MTVLVLGFLAGVTFSAGIYLLIADVRPRRRSLAERLLPYRPHVADEVESWLRRRSP